MAKLHILLWAVAFTFTVALTSSFYFRYITSLTFGTSQVAVRPRAIGWKLDAAGDWDLSRSGEYPATGPRRIPTADADGYITIEPSRTSLVVIDMQNLFLHDAIVPHATDGRRLVPDLVSTIERLRRMGIHILWFTYAIEPSEVEQLPPALIRQYASGGNMSMSIGSWLGIHEGIDMGKKLVHGSWNVRLWGPLEDLFENGRRNGTDVLFDKTRYSGFWETDSPAEVHLRRKNITTLLFSGVNLDQCVFASMLDSYQRGFDVILVDDLSATTSPLYATKMVQYNVNGFGFRVNSTDI